MPPPKITQIKKKKIRKEDIIGPRSAEESNIPSLTINTPDSDSDTACGFGTDWQ